MDPDPAIFILDLQDANKKLIKKVFLLITFYFFKDLKVQNKSQNSKNQGFFLTIFAG
jgi:hypothetical protein